jgi:hypothetical protein
MAQPLFIVTNDLLPWLQSALSRTVKQNFICQLTRGELVSHDSTAWHKLFHIQNIGEISAEERDSLAIMKWNALYLDGRFLFLLTWK